MITRIREVRRARGMTLEDVARALPPADHAADHRPAGDRHPDGVGRLAQPHRRRARGRSRRIWSSCGERAELTVAAVLGADGAHRAPRTAIVVRRRASTPAGRGPGRGRASAIIAPATKSGARRSSPDDFGRALNRDVLVPRPAGRFLFGRLIDRDATSCRSCPGAGGRQQVVANPPWLRAGGKLVRACRSACRRGARSFARLLPSSSGRLGRTALHWSARRSGLVTLRCSTPSVPSTWSAGQRSNRLSTLPW